MNNLRSGCRRFFSWAFAVALCGCGHLQLPIVSDNTMGPSWMNSKAANGDLMYVAASQPSQGVVYVLTFPRGTLLQTLTGFDGRPQYLCSDNDGHVFVTAPTSLESGEIYEFNHGGTKPIAQLTDPGFSQGCSVDPTTGNLAVANYSSPVFRDHYGNVVIYRHARGAPKVYADKAMHQFQFCGYDSQGNLLADGADRQNHLAFVLLPPNTHQFRTITLNKPINRLGPIEWDGKYFGVGDLEPHRLYRVSVSGSSGTVVNSMRLLYKRNYQLYEQFSIQDGTILAIIGPKGGYSASLGLWKYPAGGKQKTFFQKIGTEQYMTGVTISLAHSKR
jgi:hypothetical protein